MPGFISDSPLARELISIGDEAIATEDDAKLRAYFSEDYVFHGPGADLGFDELSAYFGHCAPLSSVCTHSSASRPSSSYLKVPITSHSTCCPAGSTGPMGE